MATMSSIGLYISVDTLVRAPDYVRALVEEHGVNLFVIRVGFDPRRLPPNLDAAVNSVVRLGVGFQFLVGAWWGEGRDWSGETMQAPAYRLDYDRNLAHEAKWPMEAPGGECDNAIRDVIDTLCTNYSPSGICLTHARFKHAADIDGLFSMAGGSFGAAMESVGITPRRLDAMLHLLDQRLEDLSMERGSSGTPIGMLDSLTESDFFSRWFEFRCHQVTVAVQSIFAPIRVRHPEVKLGTNAMGPLFGRLCGQDYLQLASCCDFVQPLLGYMRWHVLQPIYAWAALLQGKGGRIDARAALEISARLFGLTYADCALDWARRNASDEGPESAVVTVVQRQLNALDGMAREKVAPVLRGHGLTKGTIERLFHNVKGRGFPSVLFQVADDAVWQGLDNL